VKREIGYGMAALRRRPLFAVLAWSIPEAVPAAVSGLVVARAVDTGFLAGRPTVGLGWLAVTLLAAGLGAIGSRQVYRRLGDLVEPFRDALVRRVVSGALRAGVAGKQDDGAVARLVRQVEIVRDTYAGLLVVLRGFAVTVVGVVAGLLSVAPVVTLLVLPPFVIGVGLFVVTLGSAATRQRAAVHADERLAAAAGAVFAGTRDVIAAGTEEHAAGLVTGPVRAQADAERALATVAALRTLCFAVGGWLPLVVLLVAGPWLIDRGLTAGQLLGGLTYVLVAMHPVLATLMSGLGGSGLRYVVTLGRILDASGEAPGAEPFAAEPFAAEPGVVARRHAVAPLSIHGLSKRGLSKPGLSVHGLSFAYGPHAEPVLHDLTLTVPPGDHLTIVGPSGIGKSTLAGLLCGLLRPDSGTVCLDGTPVTAMTPADLAALRVLIPQEAYLFTGTVWDNLAYLRPDAHPEAVLDAIDVLGADALVARLGGLGAEVHPGELSAGQRQILALVRAYVSPAPLVVLDEATCHLDPASERRAEEAFATRGGTLVVIAHRISSALRASRVLVLDGRTAICGDHATVRMNSPLYRELLGHWAADVARPIRTAIPDGCRSSGIALVPPGY
jgi:ATP-binding cassette subfamily C protein